MVVSELSEGDGEGGGEHRILPGLVATFPCRRPASPAGSPLACCHVPWPRTWACSLPDPLWKSLVAGRVPVHSVAILGVAVQTPVTMDGCRVL